VQPGTRPFLISGGALDDRNQRAARGPILQRRQLYLADLDAETPEGVDRCGDAALGIVADLVVGLVEMVDYADLEALDLAAECGAIVRNGPISARGVARIASRALLPNAVLTRGQSLATSLGKGRFWGTKSSAHRQGECRLVVQYADPGRTLADESDAPIPDVRSRGSVGSSGPTPGPQPSPNPAGH
jgi:hypothetical protein